MQTSSPPPSLLFYFPEGSLEGGCHSCTPDELAALCQEIQEKTNLVKKHTYHLIAYKNCFVGRELVDWLVKEKKMGKSVCLSATCTFEVTLVFFYKF